MIKTWDHDERLAALAQELRLSGTMGRSELINRLFGFLLAQSLNGRSPKEIEVAQEVFGKTTAFDVTQDASVRVHIHRLRRKLDEIYAGAEGERLVIPRGEYRLAVESPAIDPPPDLPVEPDEDPPAARTTGFRVRWLVLALCLGLAIGAAVMAGLGRMRARPAEPLATTILWQPLAGSRRMTFLATGDYYLFGEAANDAQVTRLVREFSINSREDLDQYLMTHPDDYHRYVDLDLHYLPVSTAYAQREVLPLMIDLTRQAGAGRPWAITMSRLTPEALKGSNIVYIGFLSGLGMLRDPLFEASGFTVGASYDELIDRTSGKHYVTDWQQAKSKGAPRRDYAYLASFPGPSGNRILIIAGTRDAAVMQAAEIATDPVQLAQIAARAGNRPDFEALYEVRTLGTLNLGSTFVLARPLTLNGLWRPGVASGKFPDDMPMLHDGAAPAKP